MAPKTCLQKTASQVRVELLLDELGQASLRGQSKDMTPEPSEVAITNNREMLEISG